jgi:Protein of unknown function (DUF4232)
MTTLNPMTETTSPARLIQSLTVIAGSCVVNREKDKGRATLVRFLMDTSRGAERDLGARAVLLRLAISQPPISQAGDLPLRLPASAAGTPADLREPGDGRARPVSSGNAPFSTRQRRALVVGACWASAARGRAPADPADVGPDRARLKHGGGRIFNVRARAGVLEMTDAGMSGAVRSMRRFAIAVAVMASSAAGCASSPGGESHGHLARCAAHALALRPGLPVSPMTGEHAVLYALVNRESAACTVRGYPQVTLYDARGRVLPFRYAAGGGAYVTARTPVTVVLAHGAMAYVLGAKYRCDLGTAQNAATIRLALPAAGGQVFSTRQPVKASGPPGLSYCRGGPRDPGQLVTISPIEGTPQATQQPALTVGRAGAGHFPRNAAVSTARERIAADPYVRRADRQRMLMRDAQGKADRV